MAQVLEFIGNHPLLVGAFVTLLLAFIANEVRRGGPSVSAQQLVNLINRENALVLDVRDRKEFSAGHIVDARNIPFGNLESRLGELAGEKDRPIVTCASTGRSRSWASTRSASSFTRRST